MLLKIRGIHPATDLPRVVELEAQAFGVGCGWTQEDFKDALKQRNCLGMVADYLNRTVAFLIYARDEGDITLLNLAVDPELWRQGLGSQLIDRLLAKAPKRRIVIHAIVRERNLRAQLFFKANGFQAVATVHGHYLEPCEDGYVFQYLTT